MVYAVGYMSLSIKLSENGGAAPEAVPYMPAGRSEICATVNGAPGRRVVVADRAAAERLNADLAEKLQAAAEHRKARPLVMFDHNVQGGAAAVPVGFEWDDERGILLRVEWTQAGREAVEGGNYGYVSPSFRLRPGSGEILGLADGVEVGSLVNDPAFERNECIAAGRADVVGCDVVQAARVVSVLDALPPRGNAREGGKSGYDNGKPGGVGSGNNQKKGKNMEEIAKLLGLPEDADAATICAKITALKNQGAVDKKRIEEVEAEKEEHKKALTEHKHAAADAFMERVKKEGKVAPHDKERLQAARNMYLADPAGAECIFAGMKRVDNVRDEQKVEADKVEAAAARRYENLSLAELLAEENA